MWTIFSTVYLAAFGFELLHFNQSAILNKTGF